MDTLQFTIRIFKDRGTHGAESGVVESGTSVKLLHCIVTDKNTWSTQQRKFNLTAGIR